jgi:hypothetical protein
MCQHKDMETQHPDERVDPETERIVRERLATFDEDKKTAKPARAVLEEIRSKLQHPAPR